VVQLDKPDDDWESMSIEDALGAGTDRPEERRTDDDGDEEEEIIIEVDDDQ
jgi:hypothetical protein